jgi:hypothetical protein
MSYVTDYTFVCDSGYLARKVADIPSFDTRHGSASPFARFIFINTDAHGHNGKGYGTHIGLLSLNYGDDWEVLKLLAGALAPEVTGQFGRDGLPLGWEDEAGPVLIITYESGDMAVHRWNGREWQAPVSWHPSADENGMGD